MPTTTVHRVTQNATKRVMPITKVHRITQKRHQTRNANNLGGKLRNLDTESIAAEAIMKIRCGKKSHLISGKALIIRRLLY